MKYSNQDIINNIITTNPADPACYFRTSIIIGTQVAAESLLTKEGVLIPIADIVELTSEGDYQNAVDAKKREEERQRRLESEALSDVAFAAENKNLDILRQGYVIVSAEFSGTIAKKRPMTKTEIDAVLSTMSPEDREKAKQDLDGMEKRLFSKKGFKELDNLNNETSKLREQFKMLGLPFASGQTIMKVGTLKKYVAMKEAIRASRKKLVEDLAKAWPSATSKEVVDSQFYDEKDYRTVESLAGMFTFKTTILGFVSEELLKEQVGEAALLEEQQDMVNSMAEVKRNSIALLRETIVDLVAGLAESLTPDENGDKKKFHPSSVTKIMEYLAAFEDRNLWGDDALQKELNTLKGMLKGVDVSKLSAGAKGDAAVREITRKQMETAKLGLSKLLVDAKARVIQLED